jgi:hypothetical protein
MINPLSNHIKKPGAQQHKYQTHYPDIKVIGLTQLLHHATPATGTYEWPYPFQDQNKTKCYP